MPNGFNVSKGDIVFFIPYAMGRMESLWGKDAEYFRPERWLDENGVFQQESPFKFTAFQVKFTELSTQSSISLKKLVTRFLNSVYLLLP